MIASKFGKTNIVKQLLELGAKINKKNINGSTALMLAVEGKHHDTIQILLDAKARVNPKCIGRYHLFDAKSHPMLLAATNNDTKALSQLIEKGGRPSVFTANGKSPLLEAAKLGHAEIVKLLLGQNQIDLRDTRYIEEAIKHGNEEVVALLINFGVSVNHRLPTNESPLNFAVRHDQLEVVKVLLSKGTKLKHLLKASIPEKHTCFAFQAKFKRIDADIRSKKDKALQQTLYSAISELKEEGVTVGPEIFCGAKNVKAYIAYLAKVNKTLKINLDVNSYTIVESYIIPDLRTFNIRQRLSRFFKTF